MVLYDRFGREIRSLRISITQRCNLNCFYCHREGEESPRTEMTVDEIGTLISLASRLDISKVKITGGEPLIRKDITEIIEECAGKMEEVSLTTNGILLADRADELSNAGLNRVNISLDSLKGETYRRITGVDALERVLEGVRAAKDAGLVPVKLNTVLLKGINDQELDEMIKFAEREGAILQLIELETSRDNLNDGFYSRYHVDMHEIEEQLKIRAERIVSRRMHHRMKYYLPTEVEVVRPMHNSEFCANCTRIRITSDGWVKPCLLTNKGNVDILGPLRSGASEEELTELFIKAVRNREPYWSESQLHPVN